MKRWFIQAACLLLVLLTAVCSVPAAAAADDGAMRTVITVRASEIKNFGTYRAIQAALDTARFSATSDNIYRVVVEPGTYDLTRALHIYSNTTLYLGGVTLIRNKKSKANMLRTGDYDTESSGATGYAAHSNIEVQGGIFDGAGTANTVMKVAHAKNFRLTNACLKNVYNGHLMEVAGVDGFYVGNCRFEEQTLDSNGVGYEAIQLDILKKGHLYECRSEALALKNVTVEGCSFNNVPRAIGTHTMILNVPFTGIKIRNNSFTNLTSAAIQGVNWKNCEISGNTIENTPRGIAIYSMLTNGVGGYRASVLASEGKTKTSVSGNYQTPTNSKIVIADNVIRDCGCVRDDYASYEYAGITVTGKKLGGVYAKFADGSGGLPAGDYYITGVTLRGNLIEADGHGIRLENVRDTKVDSNSVTCGVNNFDRVKYNGITVKNGCKISEITGCDVYGSKNAGISVDKSSVTAITDSGLSGSGTDGIAVSNSSTVGKIIQNYIMKCGRYGVNVLSKSNAGKITGNIICECKKKAVNKAKKTTATVKDNSTKAVPLTEMWLNQYEVTLGIGESYSPVLSYAPTNATVRFVWSSSDRTVATVTPSGRIIANSRGEAEVYVRSSSDWWCMIKVNVKNAPDTIKLNRNMLILGEGESFDLDSKLSGGSASHSIRYTSNNADAASVASDGVVSAHSVGTATIVAKTFNGLIANCNVIVKNAPSSLTLDRHSLGMGVGEQGRLNASIPDGSASKITWYSSDSDIVSVNSKGELTAKSEGLAYVTAYTYNDHYESCEIRVEGKPESIALDEKNVTLSVGNTHELTYTVGGSSSRGVIFKSSDPNVVRVDKATGTLTAKAEGGARITVTTYNGVSDYVDVRVGSNE